MTRLRYVFVVLFLLIGPAAWAQAPSSETLRGEWSGKVDALVSASDAGQRGFRFWADLTANGAGIVRFVVNGKPAEDLMQLRVEGDTVRLTTNDRSTVTMKLTAPGELTGTWAPMSGAPRPFRFTRAQPAKAFDRSYSGRAYGPGTQMCVPWDVKMAIKDSRLTGTLSWAYAGLSRSLDLRGEVWSDGEFDYQLFVTGGGPAGVGRGKIENGRFKMKFPTNCEGARQIYDIDLR
jgi:hypothetical protein